MTSMVMRLNGKAGATLSLGTGELSPAIEQRLIGLPEGTRATFELPAGEPWRPRSGFASVGSAQTAR